MGKKLLLCMVLVLAVMSSASAEPRLWSCHYSLSGLIDGHSDYSSARFCRMYMDIEDDDHTAAQEYMDLTGTFALSGGTYSYIDNDGVCKPVSGTSMQFTLKSYMDPDYGLSYDPIDDDGYFIVFVKEADSGLRGVNVTWNFPSNPELNGQTVIPNFRTTQEQINSFVPYAEYVRSESKVTGLRWRVVKPADVSVPVPQNFRMRFNIEAVWKTGYEEIYSGSWIDIAAGKNPEGIITFSEPVDPAEIWGLGLRLYTYEDEDSPQRYSWKFVNFSNPEPAVWINHGSRASIVNGCSDYSDAEFLGLAIHYEDLNTPAEAKYFIDEGRITIPGGGYTLNDADTEEEVGSVNAGMDMSFRLKMLMSINSYRLYYVPLDGNGRWIDFAGGAETGLNSRTITLSFPNELNMNVSRVVPNFRSANEQLAQGVPYVELLTENDNITGINYRLVRAEDTSVAVKPSYRTDIHITEYHTSDDNISSGWENNYDGDYQSVTWDNPKSLSTLEYIRVRVRTWEDPDNPCVYQWNFEPAQASESPSQESQQPSSERNGSKGGRSGCSTGFTLSAFLLTASFFLLKKH